MPATGAQGTIPSAFAPVNALYDPTKIQQQTLNEQQIGQNETEMVARISAGLLDPKQYPDEASRAAAWPDAIATARRAGFDLRSAPEAYPGEAVLRRASLLGTPSQKLAEYSASRTAGEAALGPAPSASTAPAATTTQPGSGGGGGATVAPTPVEPAALSRAQAVRDGLIARGIDPDTATAFAANALHESSANPNTGAGDQGASHGLFQWRDDRYNRYKSIYGVPPDNAPLDQQLDFVVSELNTTEGAARDRINAAQGPEAKAAAISQYYLRPRDVQGEITRRSGTARQLVTQWGGSGQPATTYLGDSLVEPGGVGGSTGGGVRGASPDAVLARLRDPNTTSDAQIRGRNIVLSSGASNDPEHAQLLAMQLQTLKDRGAGAVTVLGVGPGVKNAETVNAQLKQIAERNGAKFVALPSDQMSKDGIHPTAEGYATLRAQAVPSQAAPAAPGGVAKRTGGVDVAGPPMAPAGSTGGGAGTVPQPPANGLAPGSPGAPPAPGTVPPTQVQQQPQAPQPPQPPQFEQLTRAGLTTQQDDLLRKQFATGQISPQQQTQMIQQLAAQNEAVRERARDNYRQDLAAWETRTEREYQHARNAGADQRAIDEAARQADAAKLAREQFDALERQRKAENERAGLPTGYRIGADGRAEPIPGLPPPTEPGLPTGYRRVAGDPNRLEAIPGGPADPATTQQGPQFERANKLRDEFQTLTKDFRVVQTAYENIVKAGDSKTGPGDMAMLYAFLHMIDPQTGIKESEYGGAAAAGSLRDRINGALSRVTTGERLSDSLRDSFLHEADSLYSTQLASHNSYADQYTSLAESLGVNPKHVVTRFDHPQAPKKPVGDVKVVIP